MNTFLCTLLLIFIHLTQGSKVLLPNQRLHPATLVEDGEVDGMTLGTETIETLGEVRDRAVQWLTAQATEEYGWPSGATARVIVALATTAEDWPAKNDLVARLNIKQLEIELLEKLLRREGSDLSPPKVAFFVLALEAACKDPRRFFGHNILASLERYNDDQEFPGYPETFGYSLTSLVSCLSGSHLHRRRTRHLLQIAKDLSSAPYSIDTRATAIMALECVRHRKKTEVLAHHIHQPLVDLAARQEEDGSFGNTHSTALAIQALAVSKDLELSWNKTAAAIALATSQDINGSFLNNVVATVESLLAVSSLLNGLGLLKLGRERCNSIRQHQNANSSFSSTYVTDEIFHTQHPQVQGGNLTETPFSSAETTNSSVSSTSSVFDSTVVVEPTLRPISINYWLWIGPDPLTAEKHNLTITVPENTTFFAVMQRAAELAPSYEFSSTVWPNGHYIHTIASQHEKPVEYHYWLLYLLRNNPDPAYPPSSKFVAPAGVDDLFVEDGQVYLFWYKRI